MPKKIVTEILLRDKLSKTIEKTTKKIKKFEGRVKKTFKELSKFRNIAAVAGFALLGRFVINAAASMEVFSKQLELVSDSAEDAKQKLDFIREFARKSPLETEDVVQAYVRLRAVGIDPTAKQFKTLGGVAVLMNREMTEVLDSFIGLNKRTLRRLGIDIDRTGQKVVIQSGNIRKEVNKDTASIRAGLIEVWEERFPNAIVKAAGTTRAQVAIMKSNIFELSVLVGESLLPAMKFVTKAIGEAAFAMKRFLEDTRVDNEAVAKQAEILAKGVDNARKRYAEITKQIEGIIDTSAGYVDTTTNLVLSNEDILELLEKQERFHKLINKLTKSTLGLKVKSAEEEMKLIKELGKGILGTKGEDLEKKAAAEKKKNIAERMKSERELTEAQFDFAMSRSDIRRTEREEEHRLNLEAMADIDARIAKEKEKVFAIINANMRLGSSLNTLARVIVSNSRAAAKKKQNILLGLAIAEGAASAVTAAKAGWDSGFTVWDKAALAAAAVIDSLAMSAVQITTIKSQKFARGTKFAPGGTSLIGEEGPELVRLPRGSQVFSGAQTRNMIGGATISPTIIVQGNASDSTVAKIENTLQNFAKTFEDAIHYKYVDIAKLGLQTA